MLILVQEENQDQTNTFQDTYKKLLNTSASNDVSLSTDKS